VVCTTLRFEMHVHTILIVLTHQVLHSMQYGINAKDIVLHVHACQF
jgi:hypothetical protein